LPVPLQEVTGLVALWLALFGPPLLGVIELVVSLLRFRNPRARPPIVAAISALVIWVALCAGATMIGVQASFGIAWGWAHSQRDRGHPVFLSEQLTVLGIVCGGLLILGACGALLYRSVRRKAHSI
jgi:ABC-type Fe3+ transport system permease subunit